MPRRPGRQLLHTSLKAASVVGLMTGIWAAQPSPLTPASSGPISIDVVSVPLNPQNPSATSIGDFHYAGGLALTSRMTDRLHGLSALEITDTGKLIAVGDTGVLLEARLVFDGASRLVGLTEARLTPLTGIDGKPLTDKEHADAEGLALLSNGDRLVSFERDHRIWLYPAAGGAPRRVPSPDGPFPPNAGMEALATDPEAGADVYVVGAETSGDTWTCRMSAPSCVKGLTVAKPEEFGLVAMARLPGRLAVYLLRAYDDVRGSRISLQIVRSTDVVARMDLARPMTVDNFEGVAAVPRTDGGARLYLLSDDNSRDSQRTLLLAFDWRPR